MLPDPAEHSDWRGIEPETQEERDAWLEDERALIMTYLRRCQRLAQNKETRQ